MVGLGGPAVRGVTRHEVSVYMAADAGTAVAELRGALGGTVQALSGTVASVADVTKKNASAATRDGAKVTIRNCDRADNGTVTLTVVVERPAGGGAGGAGGGNSTNRGAGRWSGGMMPALVGRLLAGADGPIESLRLADDKGRPYELTMTRFEIAEQNGGATATLALEGRPPAEDAQPRALELRGPRSVSLDATLTLRDVQGP